MVEQKKDKEKRKTQAKIEYITLEEEMDFTTISCK